MVEEQIKLTFEELFNGWNQEDVIPDYYDVIPRDLKMTLKKWYQIVKTFDHTINILNRWVIIELKLPILTRTFPSLIVSDLIGVQPMTAPTGTTFHVKTSCQNFIPIIDSSWKNSC